MPRIQPLHRNLVAKAHLLNVHAGCFLLERMLKVAISCINQSLST